MATTRAPATPRSDAWRRGEEGSGAVPLEGETSWSLEKPSRSLEGVGPQLWECHRCGGRGTFRNPLDVVPAPDPDGPYSHVFAHREECPS